MLEGLQRQRRDDLMSALRQVARLLGGLPADIAGESRGAEAWAQCHDSGVGWHDQTKMGEHSRAADGGPRSDRSEGFAPKTDRRVDAVLACFAGPGWGSYARARLSRFFAYASAKGVEPDQVSDRTVTDFAETLKRNSLIERQTQIVGDVYREWNRCAASIEGWPATRLTVPNRSRQYALPASAYPPSFGADVKAYLDHQARGDLFGGTGRGPASPVTIQDLRFQLFQMAAALVLSGRDPQTIRSLADLVQPEALKTALNFFWSRNGDRKTSQLHGFALTAIKIAKCWVKAPLGDRSPSCRRSAARSLLRKQA